MLKRMTVLCLALALCVLTGCATQYVWETVDDTLPAAVNGTETPPYRLDFDVPDDVLAPVFSDDGNTVSYEQIDGHYEISVQTLRCDDPEQLVRRLSGFEPERLEILNTRRFGLPEYQFAWYQTGESGGRLCRADVLCDAGVCYALTFSVDEACTAEYEAAAQHVFESLVLNAASDF